MDKSEKIIIGVFISVMLFCFYGCTMSLKQHNAFAKNCIAAGGVPFQPKYDSVCLKKDQIQPMK